LRIFITKTFQRSFERYGVPNDHIVTALTRALNGQIDTNYGGGVVKQRVSRENQGKSRGFRAIILIFGKKRALFAEIFAKKDQSNLSDDQIKGYKKLKKTMANFSNNDLDKAVKDGVFFEIEGENAQDLHRRGDGNDP
tara:strand:- start:523 stop:936 length:414 start_codon:yes stop_codon:yes gene_type:complete